MKCPVGRPQFGWHSTCTSWFLNEGVRKGRGKKNEPKRPVWRRGGQWALKAGAGEQWSGAWDRKVDIGKGYGHSNASGREAVGPPPEVGPPRTVTACGQMGGVWMKAQPPACSCSPPAPPSCPSPHSALGVSEHGGCKALGHSHQTGSVHLHQEIIHLDPRGVDIG